MYLHGWRTSHSCRDDLGKADSGLLGGDGTEILLGSGATELVDIREGASRCPLPVDPFRVVRFGPSDVPKISQRWQRQTGDGCYEIDHPGVTIIASIVYT